MKSVVILVLALLAVAAASAARPRRVMRSYTKEPLSSTHAGLRGARSVGQARIERSVEELTDDKKKPSDKDVKIEGHSMGYPYGGYGMGGYGMGGYGMGGYGYPYGNYYGRG